MRATSQLRFRTRPSTPSRGPAHFVDSVRVQKGGATVYGHYGLASMGRRRHSPAHGTRRIPYYRNHPMMGTEIGAIAVPSIHGRGHRIATAEVRDVVRDMPPAAFAARAGYKSIGWPHRLPDADTLNQLDDSSLRRIIDATLLLSHSPREGHHRPTLSPARSEPLPLPAWPRIAT